MRNRQPPDHIIFVAAIQRVVIQTMSISDSSRVLAKVIVSIVVAQHSRVIPRRGPQAIVVRGRERMAFAIAHSFDRTEGSIRKRTRIVCYSRITCTTDVGQSSGFVITIADLSVPLISDALQLTRKIVFIVESVIRREAIESARLRSHLRKIVENVTGRTLTVTH